MRSYIAQWHSGMKSRLPYLGFGRWTDFVVMRMRKYQARDWLRKRFCFANACHVRNLTVILKIYFSPHENKIW